MTVVKFPKKKPYISSNSWDYQGDVRSYHFFDDRGENICSIGENDFFNSPTEEVEAHARVISAAPEMLSLLREMLKDITTPGISPFVMINWGIRIREIIAKVDEDGE